MFSNYRGVWKLLHSDAHILSACNSASSITLETLCPWNHLRLIWDSLGHCYPLACSKMHLFFVHTMVVSASVTVTHTSRQILRPDDAMPQSTLAVSFGSLLRFASQLTAKQTYSPPTGHSVQILYQTCPARNEHGIIIQVDGWSTFFGPRGQPVNPCAIPPFSKVHHTSGVENSDGAIDNPPFPRVGLWAGLPNIQENIPCLIICDGESMPLLRCAAILDPDAALEIEFVDDPWFHDPAIECSDGCRYHRAYYLEYTVDD